MFYSGTLLRTIAQETASQIALRNCSKEEREEPGYTGVFTGKKAKTKTTTTKTHVVKHQKITANHKKHAFQVNDFSVFLSMGRCKSLGSLKLFLRYVS